MKTKSTIVLILLLLFALMLASCGDGGDEDADGDEGLSLIESGEPTFQIVIAKGSSADVRRTVDFDVVRALERDYGISVTSVTEGSSDDQICDIEVLVGSAASRGEQYCYDAHTLGEEGYIIKRIGTKVVIGGGSDESICRAISEFCTDILGMGSGALEEAVMYFSDSKEIVQSNYKITSLSVSGNDMRGYSIVTDTADASYRECAEAFSDTVYKKSGYYRTKEERAADARKKTRIKKIEDEIAALEEEDTKLNGELSNPAVTANFTLLTEMCNRLEEIKTKLDELYAEYETLI